MMVGVFSPSVDRHFEQGESSAAVNGQPPCQDASAQPPQQSVSVQPTHVTTPPEIIPYYRPNHSIWSLGDNKEASR
jgi:hypothetical protein